MFRFMVGIGLLISTTTGARIAECIPASDQDVAGIRLSLDSFFADAPAVRFKDVCISQSNPFRKTKRGFCGLVNAKNQFGAYTGYTPFMYLEGSKSAGVVTNTDAPGASYCTMCAGDPICAKYK